MRENILVAIAVFIAVQIGLANEADSVWVIIRNKMTGKVVDWEYTLSIYSDKDTISTKSKFSKAEIASIGNNESVSIRLDVYDHYLVCDFHTGYFESLYAFNFNLNFEVASNRICNRVYYTSNEGETFVRSQANHETTICDDDSASQYLQIVNAIYMDFNDEMKRYDYYFEDFVQYNGTYKAALDDSRSILLELEDSTNATITFIQNGSLPNSVPIGWMFDDEQNSILLSILPPDNTFLTNINLNECAFIFEQGNSSVLGVYVYKISEGKIIEEKVMEFVKS